MRRGAPVARVSQRAARAAVKVDDEIEALRARSRRASAQVVDDARDSRAGARRR